MNDPVILVCVAPVTTEGDDAETVGPTHEPAIVVVVATAVVVVGATVVVVVGATVVVAATVVVVAGGIVVGATVVGATVVVGATMVVVGGAPVVARISTRSMLNCAVVASDPVAGIRGVAVVPVAVTLLVLNAPTHIWAGPKLVPPINV